MAETGSSIRPVRAEMTRSQTRQSLEQQRAAVREAGAADRALAGESNFKLAAKALGASAAIVLSGGLVLLTGCPAQPVTPEEPETPEEPNLVPQIGEQEDGSLVLDNFEDGNISAARKWDTYTNGGEEYSSDVLIEEYDPQEQTTTLEEEAGKYGLNFNGYTDDYFVAGADTYVGVQGTDYSGIKMLVRGYREKGSVMRIELMDDDKLSGDPHAFQPYEAGIVTSGDFARLEVAPNTGSLQAAPRIFDNLKVYGYVDAANPADTYAAVQQDKIRGLTGDTMPLDSAFTPRTKEAILSVLNEAAEQPVVVRDDIWAAEVPIYWEGTKEVSLPWSAFSLVNPRTADEHLGHGDGVLNLDQNDNGGLLMMNIQAFSASRIGGVDITVDNPKLAK